jgi:hypothetical protein
MLEFLELLWNHCNDFLYYSGMKDIKVLDPCVDLRSLNGEEVWGGDPIPRSR